jgi:hypothetical protein
VALLRELFGQVARPLSDAALPGTTWHGWRPVAVDGTAISTATAPTRN